MEYERRLTSCFQHLGFQMLSVAAMVAMMASFASGMSRDSAFLGYSERPLVFPQFHGLTPAQP
jgi:hypothetical protein